MQDIRNKVHELSHAATSFHEFETKDLVVRKRQEDLRSREINKILLLIADVLDSLTDDPELKKKIDKLRGGE